MQVLLNSLRRLLAVVPQTEHTLSRWCGGPPGHRPNSPSAGPPSPRRDNSSMPGALDHDGPGQLMHTHMLLLDQTKHVQHSQEDAEER